MITTPIPEWEREREGDLEMLGRRVKGVGRRGRLDERENLRKDCYGAESGQSSKISIYEFFVCVCVCVFL